MSKHTPGPWFIWKERAMQEEGASPDEIDSELLESHDFDIMAGTPVKPITRSCVVGCVSVVTVDPGNFGDTDEEGAQIALANARLMASAPELLKALDLMEKAQAHIDGLPMFPTTHATEGARFKLFDARQAARAAIAKATGEHHDN